MVLGHNPLEPGDVWQDYLNGATLFRGSTELFGFGESVVIWMKIDEATPYDRGYCRSLH